MNVKSDIRWFK